MKKQKQIYKPTDLFTFYKYYRLTVAIVYEKFHCMANVKFHHPLNGSQCGISTTIMALFITIRVNMTDTSRTDIFLFIWRARNIVNCLLTNHTYRIIAYTICTWESAYSYARVSIQFNSIPFNSFHTHIYCLSTVRYMVLIVCMAWPGLCLNV